MTFTYCTCPPDDTSQLAIHNIRDWHSSLLNDQLSRVKLLQFLDMNADVNAPAGFRRRLTALQAAIEAAIARKNLSYLEFVLERVSGDTIFEGMPAIRTAAKLCWVDGARFLLKLGNNANSYYFGWIPPSRGIRGAISALT